MSGRHYFKYEVKLTPCQERVFRTWQHEQDKKVAEKQNRTFPYYGVSGGGYSWILTPTGVGTIIEAKNNITNDVIDLTDYQSW